MTPLIAVSDIFMAMMTYLDFKDEFQLSLTCKEINKLFQEKNMEFILTYHNCKSLLTPLKNMNFKLKNGSACLFILTVDSQITTIFKKVTLSMEQNCQFKIDSLESISKELQGTLILQNKAIIKEKTLELKINPNQFFLLLYLAQRGEYNLTEKFKLKPYIKNVQTIFPHGNQFTDSHQRLIQIAIRKIFSPD